MKPLNYFNAIVFIFGACPMQSVRSSDEAIGCILKTRRNKLKVSRVINLLPNGLTYETFFLVAGIFLTHTGSEKCNKTCKISPTIIKIVFSHQIRFLFPSSQRDKILSRVSSLTILHYIDRVELILVLVWYIILRVGENSGYSPCNFTA